MTDIKKGKTLVLEDEPYLVVSSQFLRKQATKPVMRTVLKNLLTGNTREHSFHPSDKMAEASVNRTTSQFLYSEANKFTFMDPASFEQIELEEEQVGEQGKYLREGDEASLVSFDETIIGVELSIKIDRKVIEAPPGVKGDTSTNVTKEIVIEGDVKMKAPLFIKEGDIVRLDTRTGSYVERVQK